MLELYGVERNCRKEELAPVCLYEWGFAGPESIGSIFFLNVSLGIHKKNL